MSGVTVAEEGNRRKGDASYAEVEQCILDITSWFQRTSLKISSGASVPDIQRMEKTLDQELPKGLKLLLGEVNGGIWFHDKKLLSTSSITSSKIILQEGMFPFAGSDDAFLVYDTKSGGVYEYEEGDGLGDRIASTFSKFLEEYRDSLLSGQFEYIDGIGVVEKVSSSSAPRK